MKKIINCETGEVIERELTKAEKDQEKIDKERAVAEQEALAAKAAARQALLNKLGITAEEAQLLLGGN